LTQAAHIALIEAIMGLYAKELLSRDTVITVVNRFGHTLKPGTYLRYSWHPKKISVSYAIIQFIHSVQNKRHPSLPREFPKKLLE
jgi:hypothetical protein